MTISSSYNLLHIDLIICVDLAEIQGKYTFTLISIIEINILGLWV